MSPDVQDSPQYAVYPNDAHIPIDIGGCAGVFITHNAKGDKSFHFTRVVACASLSDCVLHEPTRQIIAVRAHAKDLIPEALAAYERWLGPQPEVLP